MPCAAPVVVYVLRGYPRALHHAQRIRCGGRVRAGAHRHARARPAANGTTYRCCSPYSERTAYQALTCAPAGQRQPAPALVAGGPVVSRSDERPAHGALRAAGARDAVDAGLDVSPNARTCARTTPVLHCVRWSSATAGPPPRCGGPHSTVCPPAGGAEDAAMPGWRAVRPGAAREGRCGSRRRLEEEARGWGRRDAGAGGGAERGGRGAGGGGRAGGAPARGGTTLAGETRRHATTTASRGRTCACTRCPPGGRVFDKYTRQLSGHSRGPMACTDSTLTSRIPPRPRYWGPQYHTVPAWSAIQRPVPDSSTPADWDLGPAPPGTLRSGIPRGGPPSSTSDTKARSSTCPRRWDSSAATSPPRSPLAMRVGRRPGDHPAAGMNATVGVITSGGPNEQARIAGAKMDGSHPRAILTPVESRPLLLGVEMVPANDSGARRPHACAIRDPSAAAALGARPRARSPYPTPSSSASSDARPSACEHTQGRRADALFPDPRRPGA